MEGVVILLKTLWLWRHFQIYRSTRHMFPSYLVMTMEMIRIDNEDINIGSYFFRINSDTN
jgi:hypothetical protein